MQLTSSILIERSPAEVWSFLGDPANVPKWDRGVANVENTSTAPPGVGLEFDTVAHDRFHLADRGRMSYRIREINPSEARCVVELVSHSGNARFFDSAAWHFHTRPARTGTLLTCTADFRVRPRFFLLGLLLYFKRSAISIDLELLKQAVESQQ
jgi:hypothetical protein